VLLLLPEVSQMMLIGAIFASLALGVLLAYGVCQLIFRIFLIHAKSAARRVQATSVRISAES
jgi:hypothetical protein